jgi:stage III sporulation protein AB
MGQEQLKELLTMQRSENYMLKIIGSLIVIGATTIMGFYYAGIYVERVKQIRGIQYALNILESEIVYTSTPLAEAFKNVGDKSSEPFKRLFYKLSENLRNKNVESVTNAFKSAFESLKGEIYFEKEEIEVIYSFMKSLGNSDVEGQKKNFNITIKKLEAFELKAEENRRKNERLFKYLGVSCGMLVVIILV